MHEIVFYLAFAWMTVLLVVGVAAVIRLRSTASRILALDMTTLILVALLVLIMTVGVYGVIRMPDPYTKLHATSKAVFLGVISLCLSSVVTGDPRIIFRVVLITAFLIVTTPISAFAIARAAMLREERMETPGALDESGRGLPRAPGP